MQIILKKSTKIIAKDIEKYVLIVKFSIFLLKIHN